MEFDSLMELDSRIAKPHLVQRARQLARSGSFAKIEQIERRLSKEGYEAAFHHLQGSLMRRELNGLMREAKEEQRIAQAHPGGAEKC
jgi:hypothetical protein